MRTNTTATKKSSNTRTQAKLFYSSTRQRKVCTGNIKKIICRSILKEKYSEVIHICMYLFNTFIFTSMHITFLTQ